MIRHQLGEEPAEDMTDFIEQWAGARWMEERQADIMASAISKALGGGK